MNAIQDWVGAVSLPMLVVAIAGLICKNVFGRRSAARRTIWSFATILGMAVLATLPWWPSPPVMRDNPLAMRISSLRADVVEATVAKAAGPMYVDDNVPSMSALDILAVIYVVVACLLALRILVGWLAVKGICKKAQPFGEHAGYPVLLSHRIGVPFALEGIRPCIVVPAEAQAWPQEQFLSVLDHEASHLKRRDGLWLLLSNVLCAVQWFNPFVWIVDRSLRHDLEFLSDDEVVLKGATPASYAQSMLNLASGRRQTKTALAIPFARKAGIKQRIAAVVDGNRRRERVQGKALAGICISALACVAVGGGLLISPQQRVANPTSWAADVRGGQTSPGTPENNYTGTFKDGRKAQIVQISIQTPTGVQSWKPNGDIIPQKDAIPVRFPTSIAPGRRVIVLRAETPPTSPDISLSLGSGPRMMEGEPSTLVFGGGGMMKKREGKYAYAVSFIEVPKEDGYQTSFTFSLTDDAWRPEIKIDPRRPFTGNAGIVDGLAVKSMAKPKTATYGKLRNYLGPVTAITWTSKRGHEQADIKVVVDLISGGSEVVEGNYAGYDNNQWMHNRYYAPSPLANIQTLRIFSRESMNVEMLQVRMKPI